MKKILIATDFSRDARRATQHGVEFARLHGADIELFTAFSESSLALDEQDLALSVGYLQKAQEQTRRHLDELAEQIRGDGFSVNVAMAAGSPERAICEHVETIGADLLVVGTHGSHGFDHTFLGSVSERTARAAACTVLTVNGDAPEPSEIRKILVATDFSRDAEAALEWAQALAALTGASIVLVHSVTPPFGVGEEELYVEDERTAEEIENSRARLEEIAKRIGGNVEIAVGRRYPETDALAEADARGADLIVVGTRGRRGLPHVVLGSTTIRIMRSAKIPVASVKHDA